MARVRLLKGLEGGPLLWLAEVGARMIYGKSFNQIGAIAHNRSFILPFLQMSAFSQGKTQLSPQVRAMAMSLAAELNGCGWCMDFGAYQAHKANVPAEKQRHLLNFADSPTFTEQERVALEYAQTLCSPGAPISAALGQKLRQHFSEQEVVELTVAVAAEKFFNTVNGALGIEPQGFAEVASTPRGAR
ncbi:MAG: carboxymuconolactone decarboxylase family protein [Meiothermus sp.]|nr:carboxymuconolactone decarboxylase family protein [Meiothermus sp.]